MANFKVSNVANSIGNLTISNDLHVGGTTLGGSIDKTLNLNHQITSYIYKLTAEQSGTTLILSQAPAAGANITIILPPAKIGLNYTFIVKWSTDSTGSPVYIMPYGFADGKNPDPTAGDGEAYAFSIQAIMIVGAPGAGNQDAGAVSDQVNSVVGVGSIVGGIMFADDLEGAASLKLTCISLSTEGDAKSGCRWIGTGQTPSADKILVSA